MNKIYFPGLNGVRFIAATMVIIAHIEGFKNKMGLPNVNSNNVINQLGTQGVKVFFVLSGFLITYLLLVEKSKFKTIDVKKFYVRRILRIWPLYFLVLIIGFLIIPQFYVPDGFTSVQPYFWIKIVLAIFLLPNLLFVLFGHIFTVGPLWSIGAEEQFYLIWPNVVKGSVNLISTLAWMLIALIAVKSLCEIIIVLEFIPDIVSKSAWILKTLLQFDCMVVGAILAWFYYQNHYILNWFYKKTTLILSLILLIILFVTNINLYSFSNLVFSILYSAVIINVSTNPLSFLKLENQYFNFLGKISYGMYMFHSLCVILMINLWKDQLDNVWITVLLYTSVMISTIFVSFLSYQYFEKPILKYKERFMKVKSTS